jgi:hypothetical protein
VVKFAGLDPSYPHDESDKMQYYTLDLRDVDAAVHETTVKETTAKDVTPTSPWRFICLAGPSYTGRERERNAFACIERHQAFALAPVSYTGTI